MFQVRTIFLVCYSAVWCWAVDIHLRLLDFVFSGDSFLTGGVLECNIAHRRSVAVLSKLYKIRCNPMHRLYCAIPVPYMCVYSQYRSTRSTADPQNQ